MSAQYLIFILILLSQVSLSQDSTKINYPKADLHLGISITKGSYIGTIIQTSERISFEVSYGTNMSLFLLSPGENQMILGAGVNYHLYNFILNLSYIRFEVIDRYFSHIGSLNIQLFTIDESGFHIISAVGGFYEFSKHFSDKPKVVGVNFNLALGFTIL